jgi:FtsP/CotA-like multicopper oxidase with cupredoxin domain
MHKFKNRLFLVLTLLLLTGLFFTSLGTQVARALAPPIGLPSTVVYNLYATDGYIELPDGQPLYMYGFIGGRQGQAFTYQTSCVPGKGNCLGASTVDVPDGPPTPQGGAWSGMDAQFAGNAQFPAPVIYASVGDVVEIRLKNLGVKANPMAPNDPHSIHLHGLDVDAANDGVPETSLGAVPANLCADGTTAMGANGICDTKKQAGQALGAGNVIVYMFAPDHAGTFMYHCHQEADIHVQMGMYGALVVYNQGDPAGAVGPGQGAGGTLYGLSYDKDYVLLLSEFDVRGHQDEEGTYKPMAWDPVPYNWALYKPQYWMINGLSFPQTIHAGWPSGFTFTQWIAAHPGYDPLIIGSVSGGNDAWDTPGEKVLIRVINLGFETHPMHMHGYHGKLIGSDSRGWDWGFAPFNAGLEKNTLTIGSGETYDWLVDFGQQSFNSIYPDGANLGSFPGGTQTRYDPVTLLPASNTNTALPAIPDFGLPGGPMYIPGPTAYGLVNILADPLLQPDAPPLDPVGAAVGANPGVQYFPFHNHDDYKATNNGVYPGGMFTMLVPTP